MGVADAAIALVGEGPGGMGLSLLALGLGLGAAAGALLVLVHGAVLSALLRQPVAGLRARAGAVAAALLAAPIAVHDAFALFAGPRARTMPARHLVSILLAAAALAAIFLVAGRLHHLFRQIETGGRARWQGWLIAGALAAASALLYRADQVVLPRLYPWFHNTLGLTLGVGIIVAARFALASVRPRARGRFQWRWAGPLASALGVVLGLALAWSALGRSQKALFLARERTQVTGPLLAALPFHRRPAAVETALGAPPSTLPAPPAARGPRHPGADLVLITIDALRADHVGAYGYAGQPPPASMRWPGGACASNGPTPRRRTPPSRSPRC